MGSEWNMKCIFERLVVKIAVARTKGGEGAGEECRVRLQFNTTSASGSLRAAGSLTLAFLAWLPAVSRQTRFQEFTALSLQTLGAGKAKGNTCSC